MRFSDLLLLLLLLLAAFIWLAALQPQKAEGIIEYLQSFFARPSKPPVTCGNLLAVMRQTYDTEAYDFVCVEKWTGTVELTVRPAK